MDLTVDDVHLVHHIGHEDGASADTGGTPSAGYKAGSSSIPEAWLAKSVKVSAHRPASAETSGAGR